MTRKDFRDLKHKTLEFQIQMTSETQNLETKMEEIETDFEKNLETNIEVMMKDLKSLQNDVQNLELKDNTKAKIARTREGPYKFIGKIRIICNENKDIKEQLQFKSNIRFFQ